MRSVPEAGVIEPEHKKIYISEDTFLATCIRDIQEIYIKNT